MVPGLLGVWLRYDVEVGQLRLGGLGAQEVILD